MKMLGIAAIALGLASANPAIAQDAVAATAPAALTLRSGMLLTSVDGRRIGRIESLVGDKSAPSAVKVIKDLKMVVIPTATLTAGDSASHIVTSLKYSDVR